ncbi:hypothetical protein TURBIDO_39 [Mycobacterium phage Turbido]|uniref:Lipoprotein n=6 Tax=Turbidovirus turbido TaxID=1993865 RepID=A0A1D8EZW2_9CAUD|nr:hypothetical protein TURBIDO_39 [Mycobacterium phage Turbido]AOT27777.1 hypothetical protein SEA_JERM_40 [Mycobacterium phage Jerm]AYD86588.1 membrane protein [Mycobacterium phage LilTurb]QBI96542.1 hypothetical protein SEA_WHABIGAIL7_39 [Mycobacterium phage Whabigail7]QUE25715.1 hypothetical protein SEA_SMEAGAN_41 [Mycobacterium phage Smeagan]QWS69769.1 membrane protein [Mycobacterium Phage Leviathan]QZD98219.1 hypothetical protein SEA_DIGNITY_40 [Mycobacterium phage Dignity]
MRELKQLALAVAILITIVFGLTACDGDTGAGSYDTTPHGVIYIPPIGTTPGIGPIFY